MLLLDTFIENSAALHKECKALCYEDVSISYGELLSNVDQIANFLRSLSHKETDNVGVFIEKSIEAIIAITGVLRAGGSYVPFDCGAPSLRIAAMVEQCQLNFIITSVNTLDKLLDIASKSNFTGNIIVIDGAAVTTVSPKKIAIYDQSSIKKQADIRSFTPILKPDNKAAILFTSGSTGVPKGVILSQSNIMEFINWVRIYFSLSCDDTVISIAPLFFDISLLDILASLFAGAGVVLVSRKKSGNASHVLQILEDEKVTFMQAVPSLLKVLGMVNEKEKRNLLHLKNILFTGECLPVNSLKKLSKQFINARFYNIYGCTETNDTFCYVVPDNTDLLPKDLPIGKALSYVEYKIIDEQGKPAQEGELYVKSPTNMLGYLGESQEDSMAHYLDKNKHFYKTRDLVKCMPDGQLILLGRVDNIIKVNGYRVNLLEIENLLLSHKSVQDASVVSFDDSQKGIRIAAHIICDKDNKPSSLELRTYCAKHIPAYMIPHILNIDTSTFAITPSGKIDKKKIKQRFIEEEV